MLKKIVSGAQTGADRTALDMAIKLGIPHGGWVPKGRIVEDGPVPERYELQEMSTSSYPTCIKQNVIDSDGTVIISHGKLTGGFDYTRKMAMKNGKPCLHVNLDEMLINMVKSRIRAWMLKNDIQVLKVAGPRASKDKNDYIESNN